ncbi:MAG TPA: VOC family protein [Terriglobales bacterium]|nr:VOC family protein [Terriglobales bacterium]
MPASSNFFRGVAVTIACTDIAASARFYHEILGATRHPRDEGFGCRWFLLGSFVLNLMANAEQRSPAVFPTHAMPILWLEVDDLAEAKRRFLSARVRIIDEPIDGPSIMVEDPDGLLIEVWQREASADVARGA